MKEGILSEKILDVAHNYKTTLFNGLAIIFTGSSQQITRLITFTCPCIEPAELPDKCRSETGYRRFACMNSNNFVYGMSFIFAPAVIFFIIGLLLKQNFWKAITGHRYKKETEKHERPKYWSTIFRAFVKSLIYPLTWISLALLDGEFLACSLTSLPYDMENHYEDCWTVLQTPKPRTSHWFEANRKFSQTLGLVLISSSVSVAFVIYTVTRCLSPFTIYHEEYLKSYKTKEIDLLRKNMKNKAEKEASNNVERFLQLSLEETTKELWDRVSTIYDFPHGDKDHRECTNLQSWTAEKKGHSFFDSKVKPKSYAHDL